MYHFIGIKGAGMSSLAIILKQLGNEVQGSDLDKHFFTEEGLIKNNIKMLPYSEDNIKEDLVIIRGASITEDHIELKKAKELNLEIIEYNEMVGKLTNKFKTICVAGCHGKTTTTAMISHVFDKIVGINYLIGDGTGYANKDNIYFALEACEYRRHFLAYLPYYAIITNIDLDHVDYFKDINDIIDAYTEYANKATKKIIACGDDLYTREMKVTKDIIFYGIAEDNDVIAKNINYKDTGISFDIMINNSLYGRFDLPIFGKHQLLDAMACITVCYLEEFNSVEVNEVFTGFKGAKRRFTETVVGDNIVIDDYAHHPNEVRACINAIKQKYPNKLIIAVFQPHTFTRTKEFANDLVKAFNEIDASYIMDIHPARERQEDYPNITSSIIINNLNNGYHINMDESDKLLKYNNAVFICMSPNDIFKLENDLINKLKNK